jgi:hypothetical protein
MAGVGSETRPMILVTYKSSRVGSGTTSFGLPHTRLLEGVSNQDELEYWKV